MITNNKRYFSRGIAIDKLCDAKTPKQVKAVMRKARERLSRSQKERVGQ